MDQVASFEEYRAEIRAKKIAHFIDKVKPRIDLYREVWLAGDYSEEEKQEARAEYWKLSQLIQNCSVDSWDYSSPESKNGAPKQQTEEEAERGIDTLLDEMLTYEKRSPLAIWLLPSSALWALLGFEALEPYYDLARELYPEVFEREAAREKIRKKRSKQAD